MANYPTIARELTEGLGLKIPPVYVQISDRIPEGIPLENRAAAAGCVFWERAATHSFATSPALHADCCIGVHTHNLSAAVPTQAEELGATLAAMKGLHYVADDEVMAIPVIDRVVDYVIYGPLAECTAEPDAVLIFACSKQGLIITEAVQRVDRQAPPAMGRPACAVIPQVVNHKTTAVSLGCCGARAYLDTFTDDLSLWALPGAKLKEYADQIAVFSRANQTLTSFHSERRNQVARGEHPTVKETLANLSPCAGRPLSSAWRMTQPRGPFIEYLNAILPTSGGHDDVPAPVAIHILHAGGVRAKPAVGVSKCVRWSAETRSRRRLKPDG